MLSAALIFPTQLFKSQPLLAYTSNLLLVEHPRYFTDFKFHQLKLIYHRASMLAYHHMLAKSAQVTYIDFVKAETNNLFESLKKQRVTIVHCCDPVDHKLLNELTTASRAYDIELVVHETPAFVCSQADVQERLDHGNNLRMASFYQKQRKALNLLLDAHGKPLGGKWSFDTENRKPMPSSLVIPSLPQLPAEDLAYIQQAKIYIKKHFQGNYGGSDDAIFPVTHASAEEWLNNFCKNRLEHFGAYEDAMVYKHLMLFHSGLSPMLNIGLLTPQKVVEFVLSYAKRRQQVPLNSLEGFIRQIIGWREYVRGVYELVGEQQRSSNFWNATNNLPESFWSGTTGIEPVDITIKKILDHAYVHHIERLMIIGNFMQLCQIQPNAAYTWFMELFIDAYDWVMVPNVYGMALYADGGLITTKPYISGSNYINKMGDFPRGSWENIWNALYWRFIANNQQKMAQNPRAAIIKHYLQRIPSNKITHYNALANKFIKSFLTKSL